MMGQINKNQMLKIHYRKQCEISTEVKRLFILVLFQQHVSAWINKDKRMYAQFMWRQI